MVSSSATENREPLLTTTDLALIATFAAFIAVCAVLPGINIAGSAVPLTLQTFGIFAAGAILGALRGTLAVALYLAVGTAGLPVFSQGVSGPGVWTGPSGGYLLAFPIAACVVGVAAQYAANRGSVRFTAIVAAAGAFATVVVLGGLGTAGMARVLGVGLAEAWTFATPFFITGLVKAVLAALVGAAVHRAFGDLLARKATR